MKRTLILLAAMLAALPSSVLAAEAPWHKVGNYVLSFGGGVSHFSEFRGAIDDGSLSDVQVDEMGDRFQGSVGFAGRYAGLEVGYESIGRVRLDGTSSGGSRWLSGRMSARLSGYGFTGSGLLRLPAGDRWVSQVRAGLLWWRTKERTTEAGPLVTDEVQRNGTSFVVGAGGELRVTPSDRIWLRLDATRSEVGEYDLAYYTFSGSFVFHY